MTKYLRKQKNLTISEIGFKRLFRLLLAGMLLCSVLYPAAHNDIAQMVISVTEACPGATELDEIIRERYVQGNLSKNKSGQAVRQEGILAANDGADKILIKKAVDHNSSAGQSKNTDKAWHTVSWIQKAMEVVVRQNTGRRTIEILNQWVRRTIRYLRQVKICGLLAAVMLFSMTHKQIAQYLYAGSSKEKELVPRSRLLVDFMRRADGKKNGIFSLIK